MKYPNMYQFNLQEHLCLQAPLPQNENKQWKFQTE